MRDCWAVWEIMLYHLLGWINTSMHIMYNDYLINVNCFFHVRLILIKRRFKTDKVCSEKTWTSWELLPRGNHISELHSSLMCFTHLEIWLSNLHTAQTGSDFGLVGSAQSDVIIDLRKSSCTLYGPSYSKYKLLWSCWVENLEHLKWLWYFEDVRLWK